MPPEKPRVTALDDVKELRYTKPRQGILRDKFFSKDVAVVGEWGAVYTLSDRTKEISPGGLHYIIRKISGMEVKIHASRIRFSQE